MIFAVSSPLYLAPVVAQNTTQSEESIDVEATSIHITKDATTSYTISSGASFMGAFDTTYSIIGHPNSIDKSKDLIISTITEDFGRSSTIGYVNNTASSPSTASQTNLSQPALPNPFASEAAIDEKLRNEISNAISNAVKSKNVEGEIKCIFGSSLDDFRCSFHGLIL